MFNCCRSLKKVSKKNPEPVIQFAEEYINHPNEEIRRKIWHGVELHGRTNPEDVLPILIQLQNIKSMCIRNMVVHDVGQISYKENCLENESRSFPSQYATSGIFLRMVSSTNLKLSNSK